MLAESVLVNIDAPMIAPCICDAVFRLWDAVRQAKRAARTVAVASAGARAAKAAAAMAAVAEAPMQSLGQRLLGWRAIEVF